MRRTVIYTQLLGGIFALLLLAIPLSASADEADEPGAPPMAEEPAAGRASPAVIEEIVVRSRKREESLEDVPLPVTAFTGEKLDKHFAVDLRDLDYGVPNTGFSHVGLFQQAAAFGARGIGYGGIESFADPPMAVFVDGVYMARNATALLDLFDVESVEVLRGPQGTIYGRNAFAGAVAVRNARPTGEWGANLKVELGSYGMRNYAGSIDFPIVDEKLAGKITVIDSFYEGYFTNVADGRPLNGEDSTVFRPMLKWTPNEKFDVTAIAEWRFDRGDSSTPINGDMTGARNIFGTPLGVVIPGFCPDGCSVFFLQDPVNGKGIDPHDTKDGSDEFLVGNNTADKSDINSFSFTLEMNYDVGVGTITSITNWIEDDESIVTDTDGTVIDFFNSYRDQDYESFQSELRFVSSGELSEKFDLIGGVFYLWDHYSVDQRLLLGFANPGDPTASPPIAPKPFGIFGDDMRLQSFGDNSQKRSSVAAYAQIDYHFTERLTGTVGARYSWEKKKDVKGFPIVAGSIAGVPPDNYLDVNRDLECGPQDETWRSLSPRIGMDYQLTDDVLVYGFWQRAHKSGGFVNNASQCATFDSPYDEERVDNFEFGLKSFFWDRRVQVNLNLFYAEYDDLQRSVIRRANTLSGQETFTDNAATATIQGGEMDLAFLLFEGFTFGGNFGYIDAEYDEYFADITGDGIETDNTILGLGGPEWEGRIQIQYQFGLDGIGDFSLDGSYHFRDAYGKDVLFGGTDVDNQNKLFASVNWTPPDGRFTVSAWIKNWTDDVDRLSALPVANLFSFEFPSTPRTWGFTVTAKF